eukprot:14681-Chlamydomonas_euryale.AAC.2
MGALRSCNPSTRLPHTQWHGRPALCSTYQLLPPHTMGDLRLLNLPAARATAEAPAQALPQPHRRRRHAPQVQHAR